MLCLFFSIFRNFNGQIGSDKIFFSYKENLKVIFKYKNLTIDRQIYLAGIIDMKG